MVCPSGWKHNSRKLPKAWLMRTASNMVRTHADTRPQHSMKVVKQLMCLILILMFGAHLNGSTAWTSTIWCYFPPRRKPRILASSIARRTSANVTWWGLIQMHTQCIWRLWNTMYVLDIDVVAPLEWAFSLKHCTLLWFAPLGETQNSM